MKIIQIISEHKKIKKNVPVKEDYKRVEAIVSENCVLYTRHIDIPK